MHVLNILGVSWNMFRELVKPPFFESPSHRAFIHTHIGYDRVIDNQSVK